jgi:recombination protein RecR
MDNRVKEIEELIKLISKFPGLGPKSARRIALHLLKNKDTIMKPLSQSLTDVYNKVIRCLICGNIKSKEIKCTVDQCSYYKEKCDKICVVENLADMWVILSGNIFSGYFHVLGGTISSGKKFDQKNLLIDSLIQRVKNNSLKEVIIATSATVEGQTTAHFIEDAIKNSKIKITKLAQGLPVGGEIEQLDDGTLYSAFENRVPVTND